MMRSIKSTIQLLPLLLLPVLAAACMTPPTSVPTEVPPSPTALQLATAVPPTTAAATSAPASPAPSTTGAEVTGAALYQLSCETCHGADRAGSTFELDGQKISVPSIAWSDLNSLYQAQPSRGSAADQVALSITKGQDETGGDLNAMMPRWSSLSQTQVDSLVQFLQTDNKASTTVPTLTADAAGLTGKPLYEAACAACHGSDGAGVTFDKNDNKITTPSLKWSELTTTYSADPSRGTVAEQVALSISKGQDETGGDLNTMMPRWSFLSQAQVDSLVQYLQTTFK